MHVDESAIRATISERAERLHELHQSLAALIERFHTAIPHEESPPELTAAWLAALGDELTRVSRDVVGCAGFFQALARVRRAASEQGPSGGLPARPAGRSAHAR